MNLDEILQKHQANVAAREAALKAQADAEAAKQQERERFDAMQKASIQSALDSVVKPVFQDGSTKLQMAGFPCRIKESRIEDNKGDAIHFELEIFFEMDGVRKPVYAPEPETYSLGFVADVKSYAVMLTENSVVVKGSERMAVSAITKAFVESLFESFIKRSLKLE